MGSVSTALTLEIYIYIPTSKLLIVIIHEWT